jgi:hypothetical protein
MLGAYLILRAQWEVAPRWNTCDILLTAITASQASLVMCDDPTDDLDFANPQLNGDGGIAAAAVPNTNQLHHHALDK